MGDWCENRKPGTFQDAVKDKEIRQNEDNNPDCDTTKITDSKPN